MDTEKDKEMIVEPKEDFAKRVGKVLDMVQNADKLDNNRATVVWVGINEVLPNPLNPREDDSVKSDQMVSIVKKRGWEEPITVYQRGKMYVVLAGHRRLYAARQAKVKQIPVFIVDPPKNHQEEIERIASLQSGRVDWTPLEWAKFTYERWISWNRPPIKKFADDIKIPLNSAKEYIQVLEYFPLEEIENGLRYGTISVRGLYDIVQWMRLLKKSHPLLVDELSEEMIRRTMITKWQSKRVNRPVLQKKSFMETVPSHELKTFFLTTQKSLEEVMIENEFSLGERTFHGKMVSVGISRKNVKSIAPKSVTEAKKAAEALAELKESVEAQLSNIKNKYPELFTKNDLFDWK